MEEESSIERENVFHHAVHTLILNTTSVMDLSMKKGSAMNSVAKVGTIVTVMHKMIRHL